MNFIHFLSTVSTGLSTQIKDNFSVLTSAFTTFPQKTVTPITTTFIYKYLSPQANLWDGRLNQGSTGHSVNQPIYAKLSNLRDRTLETIVMRASA